MNLAEIRKKANRDREDAVASLEGARSVVLNLADCKCENATEPDCLVSDDPIIEMKQDLLLEMDTGVVEDIYDSPMERVFENEPEEVKLDYSTTTITSPAFAASAAMEFSPSFPSTVTPEAVVQEVSSELTTLKRDIGQDQLSDPLAILIAGRIASGYGDEQEYLSDDVSEEMLADYQEFLCFRVCTEQYAINIMEIKEIIKPREITEVPRSPDFISGVLSLRGIIIPVFNMVKRLHLVPVSIPSRERIIVVSKGEELFGIQVDEVLQVVRIPEDAIEQPPAVLEGIDRDFVQGIGRYSSGMLILLNMGSILDVSLY